MNLESRRGQLEVNRVILQNYRGRIFFEWILAKSFQKKSYLDNFADRTKSEVSIFFRISTTIRRGIHRIEFESTVHISTAPSDGHIYQ